MVLRSPMPLNLRQIEVFRAVMVTGSISGAARLLRVSQPAVSRLVAHTEDRLQARLFERRKGRLHPTPEAQRLFQEVDDVYRGVQRVNDLARDLLRRSTGYLSVVASTSPGYMLVPKAIAEFRRRQPEVLFRFEILTMEEVTRQLISGHADIALTILPITHPNLQATKIADSRLVCISPTGHPLERLETVTATDIIGYPLIGYSRESPYGALVAQAFKGSDHLPDIAIEVRLTQVACSLVAAGAGVALVDEFAVRGVLTSGLVARPVEPLVPITLTAVNAGTAPMSRLALAFVEIVRELVEQAGLEQAI